MYNRFNQLSTVVLKCVLVVQNQEDMVKEFIISMCEKWDLLVDINIGSVPFKQIVWYYKFKYKKLKLKQRDAKINKIPWKSMRL